jgi:hypothetical protein
MIGGLSGYIHLVRPSYELDSMFLNLHADIPDDAAKQLVEEYSYELPESDGEIFRNIVINRHCDIIKNKWLSYLTPAKQKNAKQFVDDGLFNDSLDELTEMVGLFASLKLGEFHRLFNTRCGDVHSLYIAINLEG